MKPFKIDTKRIFRYIMALVRRYLLIILLVLLGTCVYKFTNLNNNSLQSYNIDLDVGKNLRITDIRFLVYHDDKFDEKGDIVIISGKLNKLFKNNPDGNNIIISLPGKLKLDEYHFKLFNTKSDMFPENKQYYFKIENSGLIYLKFIGNIFNRDNQEINNVFYINYNKPENDIYPPSYFEINGLFNYYNINTIPDHAGAAIYNWRLQYPASKSRDSTIFSSDGIMINAEHKVRKYQNQNWSFLYTTLIGILLSAIIQLIIAKFHAWD